MAMLGNGQPHKNEPREEVHVGSESRRAIFVVPIAWSKGEVGSGWTLGGHVPLVHSLLVP